ncbi:MAG: hypothetical protein NVSMB64_00010 [Candidatus Velthaea sp.]
MSEFVCGGLRTVSLLGYLKTIGIARAYALQLDPEVKVRLTDDGAKFSTKHTRETFERFFLETYAPTPVVNPWNKGGGVAKNSKSRSADELVRRIERTTSDRWQPYRDAIVAARSAVVLAEAHDLTKDADRKKLLVSLYRARCPEAAIAWIDTAVILGAKDAGFPPIVGSGGNDGRLDFGVTFADFALKVMDDRPARGFDRGALLSDALNGTTTTALVSGSLGQYAPATSVKFNLGNGMLGDGFVNPWDYVFAIEGTVAFAGAIAKRANTGERTTAPFSFSSIAAGFGTASSGEDTRGELWLPIWIGTASWPAISALLRRGRLEVDLSNDNRTATRSARNSLDAVHGALTLGMASGVDRMERVVFAARNGLAYTGMSAGTIRVGERRDPAIASLNRETLQWVTRTASLQIGAQASEAIHAYEATLYRYSSIRFDDRSQRAIAFQDVIAALGTVARTVALAPPREHRPLPFLDPSLLERDGPLDDGSSEHRIARALASLRFSEAAVSSESIRFDLICERFEGGRPAYGSDRKSLWHPDTVALLASLAERRTRDPAAATGAGLDNSLERAFATDFESFLSRDLDLDRLGRLVLGYSLVHLERGQTYRQPVAHLEPRESSEDEGASSAPALHVAEKKKEAVQIPAAFAILKMVIDRIHPPDVIARPPMVKEIVPLLLADNGERALSIAERRLRATGFEPRDVRDVPIDDPLLYAAALIVPANGRMHQKCKTAALRGYSAFA